MSKFLVSPFFIFLIFALLFVLHWVATAYNWYASVLWLDSFHHFLGGVWIAAVFFYFLKNRPGFFEVKKSFLASLIFVLGFTAIAGIAWEFFEFGLEKYAESVKVVYEKMQLQDTLGDLFFDLLGGLLVAFLYLLRVRKD